MVDRYISLSEVEDYLELGTLNETDYPKASSVKNWITAAEEEADELTSARWDIRQIDDELISPLAQTDTFLLQYRPLVKIITLEYQNGDEWTADWETIDTDDYRIVTASISKIKTKEYYWEDESLRCTYVAGYEKIPYKLKELCLLLVEKRYIMNQMGIAAKDQELMSIASIRLTDKSNSSLKYRYEGLEREINDRLSHLKGLKAKNHNIGYMYSTTNLPARYRMT